MKIISYILLGVAFTSFVSCKYKCTCSYYNLVTEQQEITDYEYKGTITRAEALNKCEYQEGQWKIGDPNASCVLE